MSSYLAIPLEVLGIGIVISYGIAFLIKIMLDVLRAFSKKDTK
jgi:hypothetical protein